MLEDLTVQRQIGDQLFEAAIFFTQLPQLGGFPVFQGCRSLRHAEAATPIADITRKLGISEATFYAWRKSVASKLSHTRYRSRRRPNPSMARWPDASLPAPFTKRNRRVLRTLVRVMDDAVWPAPEDRHFKRFKDELSTT